MSRLYSYFLFLHVGDALQAIIHSIQYIMPLVYHNASFGRHFFRMKQVKICKGMKKHLRVNYIMERALRFGIRSSRFMEPWQIITLDRLCRMYLLEKILAKTLFVPKNVKIIMTERE